MKSKRAPKLQGASGRASSTMTADVGRQFTRRTESQHFDEEGRLKAALVELDGDLIYSAKRLAQIKGVSIALLDAAGLEATATLAAQPGGSALRDKVLNGGGFEADSREGLAARIIELCIRVEYFVNEAQISLAVGDAFRLGQLLVYSKVYASLGAAAAEGGKKRKGLRDPLKASIGKLMRKSKVSGTDFNDFLDGWLRDGIHDGLRIRGAGAGSFKIEDLNAVEDAQTVRVYTVGTMRKDYSKAGSDTA